MICIIIKLHIRTIPHLSRPASKHEYGSKLTGFTMDHSWAVGGSVNCRITITMSLSIFNQVKKSWCVWINTEPLYVNTPTLRVAEDCCTVCSNIFIMRILISTCQPTWLHHHFTLVLIPSITFFNTLGFHKALKHSMYMWGTVRISDHCCQFARVCVSLCVTQNYFQQNSFRG